MANMILSYFIFPILTIALAHPDVAFPFNSQVPLVARVGHQYRFTFSQTTFAPNGAAFQYILTGAPAWLNLDSASRTLSGTPDISDVGSPKFSILASAGSEKTPMEVTLVVVNYQAPRVGTSISKALKKAGQMCGPNSVLFPPRTRFSFDFPSDTFNENGKKFTYYSTLSDHTPLPGWLSFDPQSLHFQGSTPPLSSSPQYFEVWIIASDVPGFAGAVVSFTIVVSDHQFYFREVDWTVTVREGDELNVEELRSHLILDGKSISDSDLTNSASDAPSWLSLEPNALSMTGVPPLGAKTQDVSIAAYDRFGDTTNMTLHLNIIPGFLTSKLDIINATIGKRVKYTFDRSLFVQKDLKVTIDLGSASSWLYFDPTALTLEGEVPSNLPAQIITGEVTIASQDGSNNDSLPIAISIQATQQPTSAIATRSSNSSISSPTAGRSATGGTASKTSSKKRTGVIVGVIIAILFAILCLTVGLFCCRTPRQGIQRNRSALKKTISRPTPARDHTWSSLEMEQERGDLEKGSEAYHSSPDDPPQVNLDLSPKKATPQSSHPRYSSISPAHDVNQLAAGMSQKRISVASSTIDDGDAVILDNINRTSWGYMGTSAHKQARDSWKLANQMTRASRQLDHGSPTPYTRLSRTTSYTNRMSPAYYHIRVSSARKSSGGLPINLRLTGIGHGSSPLGSNRENTLGIPQMQRKHHALSYNDTYGPRSESAISTSFPQPGSSRLFRQSSQFESQRNSARDSILLDPRRASAQRPVPRRGQRSNFFSGGHSSRGSSRSGRRSAVVGLSTIHASPDLENDHTAAEPSDGLAPSVEVDISHVAKFEPPALVPPLHHTPTHTNSPTAKAWQNSTTAITAPNSDAAGEPSQMQTKALPPIPKRNPEHTSTHWTPRGHKRWSSSHLRSRVSRPFSRTSSELATLAPPCNSSIRDSAIFASADEGDMGNASSTEDDGTSMSVYSQTSMSLTSPTHQPPSRAKVPIGGVRVPPFSDGETGRASPCESIMARPHPRASFRKYNAGTGGLSGARSPLKSVRGGENRVSGSGFSSGRVVSGDGKGKGKLGYGTARSKGLKERNSSSRECLNEVATMKQGTEYRRGREGSSSTAFL